MITFLTWPKADTDTIASKYLAETGETLLWGRQNDTHYTAGSNLITPAQQATLEADPDFANVTFSDTPPEGF